MTHYFRTFAAAAALIALAACSKTAQEPADTLHPVKFNVSTLAAEYAALTKATGSDKINTLTYFAQKNGSGLYAEKNLGPDALAALDLSELEIMLPSGTFKVYFVAGGKDSSTPLSIESGLKISQVSSRELFLGAVDNVNAQTATEYAATLERQSGAITLNITDIATAPETFTKVGVSVTRPYIWYPVTGATEGENSAEIEFTKAEITAGTVKASIPFDTRAAKVKIYHGATVKNTYSVNMAVYRNQKTVLTGEIFGGKSSFAVTVDDAWGADNPVNIQ